MGVPDTSAYETLETIKKTPGLENLPIIIFTGKSISKGEEIRIKQYADSIVVKTVHSYQRILDEAGLFLHLVEESHSDQTDKKQVSERLGGLYEVLNNKTVLIADDDVRNIFALTKALEQHKMKVLAATDGKEALEILKENPRVDVVLMDMMMPEMDGYESTMEIRKIPAYKHLPILAVTAKAMMGDREKCIAAGASDYISKPVDIDQLVSLLRVWLYDKV
jgi:CheY-like chemotaxis protein